MHINDEDDDPAFYADSGATTHITNNLSNTRKIILYKGNDSLYVGKGKGLKITHIGDIVLNINHGCLNLKYVLIVPDIKKNLLSVGKSTTDNLCVIIFSSNGFLIKDK